ncbi:MAG: hypothetical protein HY435_02150 [Candidatus Liptonbacteria bacterium]|nr:hypothetical protein [Candidatus Liptonbacteria bacterium]
MQTEDRLNVDCSPSRENRVFVVKVSVPGVVSGNLSVLERLKDTLETGGLVTELQTDFPQYRADLGEIHDLLLMNEVEGGSVSGIHPHSNGSFVSFRVKI